MSQPAQSSSPTPLSSIERSAHACHDQVTAEHQRLLADERRTANWKRWGPYLSERQWGTVREDYSTAGETWRHFPHDHARSRAYRWGEDGLLGITDRQCRICFSWAMWNGKDPILKERLFGLTGPEGNHGEDVKELYYYLDSTPTHSYMRALYKYPQSEYPYDRLVSESQERDRLQAEYEIEDTGIFSQQRYFDFHVTYAKQSANHLLIQADVVNRGDQAAVLHVLPTAWFRNTWTWPTRHERHWDRPTLSWDTAKNAVRFEHSDLAEAYYLCCDQPVILSNVSSEQINVSDLPIIDDDPAQRNISEALPKANPDDASGPWLFTENETNKARLYGQRSGVKYSKDAFHRYLINGERNAVNREQVGTKATRMMSLVVPAGGVAQIRLRLFAESEMLDSQQNPPAFGPAFSHTLCQRRDEANEFYTARQPVDLPDELRQLQRQSDASLLWTKQFYHYVVTEWLEDDRTEPDGQPANRTLRRNADWPELFNRDIISMPDKWEYPWYAAWDSAFHMIPFAPLDPDFAKRQLILFLREWYMHPNGQLPAYEWALGDVNPPVHAWACWRVFELTRTNECGDTDFLKRVFPKLLLNFTWWVNRKDVRGKNLFSGGFLGLDNIGIFDRSKPLPTGGFLEQADGTAWMAFYCRNMLTMSLQLAIEHQGYGDVASKFFEHYVGIAEAMNTADGRGLWDEEDGFYYDHLLHDGQAIPLKVRSIVGLLPLLAVQVIQDRTLEDLPGFSRRMNWFLDYHQDLHLRMTYLERESSVQDTIRDEPLAIGATVKSNGEKSKTPPAHQTRLLAIPSQERLKRLLTYMLDENEFLSPFGIRSLSKFHEAHPYTFSANNVEHRVAYVPGESDSFMFGGNSNWRGPVWLPLNYLIIEALEKYHQFYGNSLKVECPVGSGVMMTLGQVAVELQNRLLKLFMFNQQGVRPSQPTDTKFADDPHFKQLMLFHEYFHAETGLGLGASHQTGWTSLISRIIDRTAR